jgi:hypothetical protein
MVHDIWTMQKEEEERASEARFDRSSLVFGPTPGVQSITTPPTEMRVQGTALGVMYENGNPYGAFTQPQGVDPRVRQEPMGQAEQQMMVLTGMMNHMKQEAERSARRDELSFEIAQRKEDRESKQEGQKMNFTNLAAKVPQFMRQPPAKVFFGGESITDVTTAELRKYFERIASCVETVDHEAGSLNKLVKTVSRFTYQPAARGSENDGVESMVSTATEWFRQSHQDRC